MCYRFTTDNLEKYAGFVNRSKEDTVTDDTAFANASGYSV